MGLKMGVGTSPMCGHGSSNIQNAGQVPHLRSTGWSRIISKAPRHAPRQNQQEMRSQACCCLSQVWRIRGRGSAHPVGIWWASMTTSPSPKCSLLSSLIESRPRAPGATLR